MSSYQDEMISALASTSSLVESCKNPQCMKLIEQLTTRISALEAEVKRLSNCLSNCTCGAALMLVESPKKECSVCGVCSVCGIHYGVLRCNSCVCRACRYKKCLDVGMDKDAVDKRKRVGEMAIDPPPKKKMDVEGEKQESPRPDE
uniref:Nuclear receptor domain-containing protein n=1 Tax=Meloidogyne hapla TaxID=6305 RepID=A0A1I8BUH6_MELHA